MIIDYGKFWTSNLLFKGMCVAKALNYSNLTAQAKTVIVRTKSAHTRHQHRRSITLYAMSPHAPHDDNWRRKTCRQFRAQSAPAELYNGNTNLCCPNEEWTICRVKLLLAWIGKQTSKWSAGIWQNLKLPEGRRVADMMKFSCRASLFRFVMECLEVFDRSCSCFLNGNILK
jgi:hypothetical protein